jgi:heavy metal sensor kinase
MAMASLTLQTRFTIWCVTVVVAAVASFGAIASITQREIGLRRLDGELQATHAQLTRMLLEELRELDSPATAAAESLDVLAVPNRPLAVLSADGAVLASRFAGPDLVALWGGGAAAPSSRTVAAGGELWRVHVRRETLAGTPFILVVANSMTDLVRDQREVRQAMVLSIPVALLLAAGGGLWVASVGLRPISAMARRAAALPLTGEDDLGPPMRADEIGQLTTAFNALVARLRSALRTQRQFMADASHELRNPVSVIRAAADVALSREHRDEAEYREALSMTAAQSRRLGTLVDDMLVLARADAGGYPLRLADFIVDDVIDECRQAVSVLAAARGVTVAASGESDVAIHGDQEPLRRLLVNLLQNAVQHAPAGSVVSMTVGVVGGDVQIRVQDRGKGMAAEDITRIFDRFVQLDPARRSDGAGLGLTIAKWIADAHGGSLIVESSGSRGTTFCLTVPAAAGAREGQSYDGEVHP